MLATARQRVVIGFTGPLAAWILVAAASLPPAPVLAGEEMPAKILAAVWYRRAAEKGNATAQSALATMYAKGDGVAKSEIEGLAWFTIAAASGDEISIRNRDAMETVLGRAGTLAAQQRSKEILPSVKETAE